MPTLEQSNPPTLNARQETFCDCYVVDDNGRKAAIEAGYGSKYAAQTGYKLLQDPRIQRRIEEKRRNLKSKSEVAPEQLVEQYRRIAMTSPTDLIVTDDDGTQRFKRPDELTDYEKALVQDVSIQTRSERTDSGERKVTQSFTYKLVGRKDALDSLARTFGMFRDRVEHEHRHKIEGLFAFIAKHPEQSETVAMLNARHGRNVINHDTGEVEK